MSWIVRVAAIAAFVFGTCSTASAQNGGSFSWEFPAVFAPANGYAEPIRFRGWGVLEARIDVSCGYFESTGTATMYASVEDRIWFSTRWEYRAPATPQDCTITFSDPAGWAVATTIPLHVYDPAGVTMTMQAYDYNTIDDSGAVITDAARGISLGLSFYTAAGQPITNNVVLAVDLPLHGLESASADVDFVGYTDIDGRRYVSGLCNNAVGEWELVIDLQYARRWNIPVKQGTAPPGWRKHWGRM